MCAAPSCALSMPNCLWPLSDILNKKNSFSCQYCNSGRQWEAEGWFLMESEADLLAGLRLWRRRRRRRRRWWWGSTPVMNAHLRAKWCQQISRHNFQRPAEGLFQERESKKVQLPDCRCLKRSGSTTSWRMAKGPDLVMDAHRRAKRCCWELQSRSRSEKKFHLNLG